MTPRSGHGSKIIRIAMEEVGERNMNLGALNRRLVPGKREKSGKGWRPWRYVLQGQQGRMPARRWGGPSAKAAVRTRRLPKRGFHNQFRRIVGVVNVGQLEQFPQGTLIDEELLLNSGLIKRRVEAVKILGKGDIEQALSVKVGLISKGARDKITNAGGTIIEVN